MVVPPGIEPGSIRYERTALPLSYGTMVLPRRFERLSLHYQWSPYVAWRPDGRSPGNRTLIPRLRVARSAIELETYVGWTGRTRTFIRLLNREQRHHCATVQ